MTKRKETKGGFGPLFLCLYGDLYSNGVVEIRINGAYKISLPKTGLRRVLRHFGSGETRDGVLDNLARSSIAPAEIYPQQR